MKTKLLGVILFLSISFLYAGGDNIGGDILQEFKTATESWWDIFNKASLYVFWSLAAIEIVIVFGMMLVAGELEYGGIVKQLIKILLLFGFFSIFYENKDWLIDIVSGFEQLANNASGLEISLDKITDYALDVWMDTGSAVSIWDGVGEAIFNTIAGLMAGLAVLGLGITLLVVYAKFYIMLNAIFYLLLLEHLNLQDNMLLMR
jgi:type IV secretory pathway TrbL component